jgi:transcriptional regulator with XRE-family HTH domain
MAAATLTRRAFGAIAAGTAGATALAGQTLVGQLPPVHCDLEIDNREGCFDFDSGDFPERLKAAREARGLSREAFAYCFNPQNPNHALSDLESWEANNYPDHTDYALIEAILGVPISTIMWGNSQMAQAREFARECLAEFKPSNEVKPDRYLYSNCKRIKQLREAHGWSVADCAESIGVTDNDWLRLEGGSSPNINQTFEIADLFGVSHHFLTFGKEDPFDFRRGDSDA